MRKYVTLSLIIGLCFASFICETQASFNPADIAGQSFVYNVVTTNMNVTLEGKDYSVNSFLFNGEQYPSNSDVEITVDSINDSEVNYTQTIASDNYNICFPYSSEYMGVYLLVLLSYYHGFPLFIASRIMEDYDEYGNFSSAYYSRGLQFELVYFIPDNETIWNVFESLSTGFQNQSNYNSKISLVNSQTSYTEENGLIYFESYVNYLIYERELYDGELNNGFLVIYEKSTGILQGINIKGTYDGKILKKRIRCDTEFQVEIADFDMPELTLYTALSPNAGLAIISLSLTICAVVTIKRKNKNN